MQEVIIASSSVVNGMNWKSSGEKTHRMTFNSEDILYDANGDTIKMVQQCVYLGNSIRADGIHSTEISRRIGEARHVFSILEAIWKHIF